MKLPFGLCTRDLAIAVAAIFLSGCSSFSTLFQIEPLSIENQTSKQQRLGAVQLRVAKTALAHRDYSAAIGLFEEAAGNQTIRQTALLHLGQLHGLTRNRQTELATYRTLLKENPDHAEARGLLEALSTQIVSKPAKNLQDKGPKSSRTAPTYARSQNINGRSNLLVERRVERPSKSKRSIEKK